MIHLKHIKNGTLIFLCMFLFSANLAFGQISSKIRRGTIKDNTGETLTGATVQVLGTTKAVMTDINGQFAISATDKDQLKVTYVGFIEQIVKVNAQIELNFVLAPDSKALDEIVTVGYAQQRKVSVVGSISQVTTKELKQSPAANISNALGGRLPGLVTIQTSGEPGADVAQMYIRGISTFTGSQNPLVLVDGIERDLRLLEVSEIETISILKDASATSVYGVRGANGVILVTTKRGVDGKAQVALTVNYGLQTPTRLPEMVNAYDMAVLTNEGEINDGIFPTYSQEALDAFKNGSDPYNYPNNNWADEILKKSAPIQSYNFNISGGNDITKYFVSANVMNQRGLYKYGDYNKEYSTNINYSKYNFRSNLDFKLSRIISTRLNLAGIIGTKHSPGWNAEYIFNRLKVSNPERAPIRNPDGTWATEESANYNPLARILDGGYEDSKETAIQATMGVKLNLEDITKGLTANVNYSFDFNNAYNKHYTTGSVEFWRFMEDGSYVLFTKAEPLGFGEDLSMYNSRYVLEPSINYDKAIGDHKISALALYTQSEFMQRGNGLPYRRMGVAGRVTYGFKDTYLAEFNTGYNGSENFAPGHRFGFFPAFSAGWVASNEPFFNIPAITHLKIRGSYGLVGNDQIGGDRYLYLSLYGGAGGANFGNPGRGTSGVSESKIGNTNLTWEIATKSNIGIDLKMFRGKLDATIDIFHENRKNILTTVGVVPATFGGPSIITNDGEVKNSGFETELNYRGTVGKDFGYFIGGNFSFARNKIVAIPEAYQKYDYLLQKGTRVGQPFGYIATGIFQSEEEILESPSQFGLALQPGSVKYMDINGDGVVDQLDRHPIGNPHVPEIFYALKCGFNYKGFDFSCMFQGSGNSTYDFYSGTNVPFSIENNTPLKVWKDRWTPDNRDASLPRISFTQQNKNDVVTSSFWQMNANYFRFKNVEVGYELPSKLIRKIGAQSARFYVNGINLFTWSKVPVYDPENDSNQYPIMRVVNTGFNLIF